MAQVSGKQVTGRASKNGMRVPKGGFVRAGAAVARRLIMSLDGLEKQGKDHFALTAPAPIAILSTDIGTEGVVQKFADKEIWVADYRIGLPVGGLKKPTLEQQQEVAETCSQVWSSLMRDYVEALDSGARTVIADTGTEIWEILRMARFGKLTQVMPHHYGPVNAEFREFVRMAYDRTKANGYDNDVNLILLHKLKQEWVDGSDGKGRRTGAYERAGMKDVGFLVQVNAVAWRDDDEAKIPDCFNVTVSDCRHKPELKGETLAGDMCDFPNLAALVLDGEPEEFK